MSWLKDETIIRWIRWSSCAGISLFNVTIPRATIIICTITIITFKNEFLTITTLLITSTMRVVKLWSTLYTCITVNTTQTTIRACNTFEMVWIKITTYCTWIRIIWTCPCCIWYTLSLNLCISWYTLTYIPIPCWICLMWASITKIANLNAITYTL